MRNHGLPLPCSSHSLTVNELCSSFSAGTACWPCRQRKVKCDNKSPCENCVKRDHPQLCSYKPNRSQTASVKHGSAGPEASHGRKREHSPDEVDSRSHSLGPRTEPNIRTYGTLFKLRLPPLETVAHNLIQIQTRTQLDTLARTAFQLC